MELSPRSHRALEGVHEDLVKIVKLSIKLTDLDFAVLEGKRSEARQKELVAAGASLTLDSRHLTGHAVDLGAVVGGKVRWDWPLYPRLASTVLSAARQLGIPLIWGGTWKKLKDGPHFELPREDYPA